MNEILQRIQKIGIVPVVVLNDAKEAIPLSHALCEGGLPCAEVTFRTEAAEESIRKMKEAHPEMLVGAGTVCTIKQVEQAVSAGAEFVVSPGFDSEIVDYCLERDILILPGCITPSEVAKAVKSGLRVIKFFPAEPYGGIGTIKMLAAPYTTIKFMPTGGIGPKNLEGYLEYPRVIACGGSWMVKQELIQTKQFDAIKALAKEAVSLVKKIRE